jgi:uncharacterized metal-binding protein YceD (DUF177 family)
VTPEFSHVIDAETISESPRTVEIGANEAERAALARRFSIESIERLSARMRLRRSAGVIHAEGHVEAAITQNCVVTGEPLRVSIDAPFSVRYVPDAFKAPEEEERELTPEDCDTLALEGDQIDLGELAAETLALAIDPFPRCQGAEAVLRESEVLDEAAVGPFAALKSLKDRMEKGG